MLLCGYVCYVEWKDNLWYIYILKFFIVVKMKVIVLYNINKSEYWIISSKRCKVWYMYNIRYNFIFIKCNIRKLNVLLEYMYVVGYKR